MIAVDTNVLARLLLNDDAAQYQRAKDLFKSRQMFTAPVTVMLELVWVLQAYDCTAERIASGLTALLDLPSYASGMDFADALHLALCADQPGFVTFDKAFAKRATKLELMPEVKLV
jgi:predicted nucleic-acid-binding protein